MDAMTILGLVFAGIALVGAWKWARAKDRAHYALILEQEVKRLSRNEITDRRLRAEEQMWSVVMSRLRR